ncbi:MAG TPA: phosphotransferase [Chloroflexota bacterium]|nr:phosphotransferase [Chloroflexota bacterium]
MRSPVGETPAARALRAEDDWRSSGPPRSWRSYQITIRETVRASRSLRRRWAADAEAGGSLSPRAGTGTRLAAGLEALVEACTEGRHLIHSDLLHYNVLVSEEQISAVLDWGCGMFGDFLYDVA